MVNQYLTMFFIKKIVCYKEDLHWMMCISFPKIMSLEGSALNEVKKALNH